MKKYFFAMTLLVMGIGFTACSDDDDNTSTSERQVPLGTDDVDFEEDDLDMTDANRDNWTNYCQAVAQLLVQDATDLQNAWLVDYNNSGIAYATSFKDPYTYGLEFRSYINCAEQIIDGCTDIANEVGTSKIGEPRDLWESGQYSDAVYAVESWYSWHSIDDYSNNILSIRNAINGTRNGSEAANSLASYLKANNSSLYTSVQNAVTTAYNAIKSMQAPFRSYIGSPTVLTAMDACSDLEDVLDKQLKPYLTSLENDEDLKDIIIQYVDGVVLPTYADLVENNTKLFNAITALRLNPCDATFADAAEAWLVAREPWETSEAFLFGPVANLGLDPNMDSWPLDVDMIKNILANGDFSDLEWSGEYDEDDEGIEAAQNVRGYHTLEFLLFKNGQPRTYTPSN